MILITVFQITALPLTSNASVQELVNVAIGKTATASNYETNDFRPDKAFDWNRVRTQKPQSCWASNTANGSSYKMTKKEG